MTRLLPRPDEAVDFLPLLLRAFTVPEQNPAKKVKRPNGSAPTSANNEPSEWSVIFDTETTVNSSQSLRFGAFQVRKSGHINRIGLFYASDEISSSELLLLKTYAERHSVEVLSREEFVEQIIYKIGYELRASIIGFNLPFDLSRIAAASDSARGDMRGGFTFAMSPHKWCPNIQIKHLSARAALIRFARPPTQWHWRSERRRREKIPPRRGFFVDVRTLAAALLSRSFSLEGLSIFLGIDTRKRPSDEHGGPLTEAYIDYAVGDVEATWECYAELSDRYRALKLGATPVHQIYSEASLGKAYLKAMGVKPWRQIQPNVPAPILAMIMGSYFGGRSEVRIRRELRQVVLCDFLSMYPTVCTLMGLWRFVVAQGMTWQDDTEAVRSRLDGITLDELRAPGAWANLHVLVEVRPDNDLFPVRARYGGQDQATIGLNHLTSDGTLWFTLADCLASKLLSGRAPQIIRAVRFEPGQMQTGLQSVEIGGNAEFEVDPASSDFYRRLIERRQQLKISRDAAPPERRIALDAEQNAIKIAANATSYGIFVEVNVKDLGKPERVTVHGAASAPYETVSSNREEPGNYFHPLLATLITGAARLMLAITERLVSDGGLEWAFCDTDSMAIAKPEDMADAEFHEAVHGTVGWFRALNPYDFEGSILKVERVNASITDGAKPEPLHVWAVSAKRYALFNRDAKGNPVLRKASAHGLGHLLPPYGADNPAPSIPVPAVGVDEIGVDRWQHDLWWSIISAALAGKPDQIDLSFHPNLQLPAVSRYAATTPHLQRWFAGLNRGRTYREQVKPFNFMLSYSADRLLPSEDILIEEGAKSRRRKAHTPKPIAPFNKDLAAAAQTVFDRETGKPVLAGALKTYAQALAQYHLHPEAKFLNGDYVDRGITRRRHVVAATVENIGKEANRWEEQAVLGIDDDALIAYGTAPDDAAALPQSLKIAQGLLGQRALVRELSISPTQLAQIREGTYRFRSMRRLSAIMGKVQNLVVTAEHARAEIAAVVSDARADATRIGHNRFARLAGILPANLTRLLKTPRPTRAQIERLQRALERSHHLNT